MSTAEQVTVQRAMTDIASAERLAQRFADACRTGYFGDVFDDDAVVEIKTSGSTIRSVGAHLIEAWPAVGPSRNGLLRTVPTISGFATEHALENGSALWLCDVRAGKIHRATAWIVRA